MPALLSSAGLGFGRSLEKDLGVGLGGGRTGMRPGSEESGDTGERARGRGGRGITEYGELGPS